MMQFVTGRTTEIIIAELILLYWIAIGRVSVVLGKDQSALHG